MAYDRPKTRNYLLLNSGRKERPRAPLWCRTNIIISILCFWTVLLGLWFVMGEARGPSYLNYTSVAGYFLQDDPSTVADTFDYTATNFGLIHRAYDTDAEFDPDHKKTDWQRFQFKVSRLNKESAKDVQYKVLFLGRHGEGYHNVAEAFYGTPMWNCYWSMLDGNGTMSWSDAHITQKGVQQAVIANIFWKTQLANEKVPAPETYYTSPLSRCLATANITFSGLTLPHRYHFVPIIKEKLREALGIHTCDRRMTKTQIHEAYPSYKFERGFSENDELWKPDERESDTAQTQRLKELMDDIFTTDCSTFISLTSHSGAISALLRALNHRTFKLATGAVIPVLVKAETIHAAPPTPVIDPPSGIPTCTANPTPSP